MELIGRASGIAVIDDYAHNPAKIEAALAAGHLASKRLIIVYRPHGFAPLRDHLSEYATVFKRGLRGEDLLVLLPVFYAGGTAPRDVSSKDLAEAIDQEVNLRLVETLDEAIEHAHQAAVEENAVIFMGARDPGLPVAAREFLLSLGRGD